MVLGGDDLSKSLKDISEHTTTFMEGAGEAGSSNSNQGGGRGQGDNNPSSEHTPVTSGSAEICKPESTSPPLDSSGNKVSDTVYYKEIEEVDKNFKGLLEQCDRNPDGLSDNKVHSKYTAQDEKNAYIRSIKRDVL